MTEQQAAHRDAVFERIKMRSGMDRPKYAFNQGFEAGAAHSAHRISELEEALRHYANPDNYLISVGGKRTDFVGPVGTGKPVGNGYDIAQKALADGPRS